MNRSSFNTMIEINENTTFHYSNKFNPRERKSGLAQRLVSYFRDHRHEDLTFGQILDTYGEIGMSRKTLAKLLHEMTDKKIQVKETPLWEAWLAARAQGECKTFIFHSKFSGNHHHGNTNKPRGRKSHKPQILKDQILVDYTCLNCGHESHGMSWVSQAPKHFIGLKTFQCPQCEQFDSSAAKFEIHGRTFIKVIIDGSETEVPSLNDLLAKTN